MAGFLLSKIPFNKVSFTPLQQLTKLRDRGLVVANEAQALSYLQHVGGYRLKGYYYHLLDHATKAFPTGYRFEQIAERYEFDRHLRFHTFAAITRLETSVRSNIANHLSSTYGPHWFFRHDLFNKTERWSPGKLVRKVEDEVGRSAAQFVKYYYKKFDDPYLPPSWNIAECVTFGMWSLTYDALRNSGDKKSISAKYRVTNVDVFGSWLHTLTVVRNTVAHHSRLLNHKFVAGPKNSKENMLKFSDAHSFYSAATLMNYMQNVTSLPNNWKNDLISTFAAFPGVSIGELGFPNGWQSQPGW